MTARKHHQIVDAIREKAQQIVPPGSEVILFGSRARGDARDDSDWDVLILLDKDRITSQDIDDYTYPLREMGWYYDQCINAILYTKHDWEGSIASPFRQNVTEDGIRLWG
jgi:predicted nucleotidyltransferase